MKVQSGKVCLLATVLTRAGIPSSEHGGAKKMLKKEESTWTDEARLHSAFSPYV